jgi:hypothetical protein
VTNLFGSIGRALSKGLGGLGSAASGFARGIGAIGGAVNRAVRPVTGALQQAIVGGARITGNVARTSAKLAVKGGKAAAPIALQLAAARLGLPVTGITTATGGAGTPLSAEEQAAFGGIVSGAGASSYRSPLPYASSTQRTVPQPGGVMSAAFLPSLGRAGPAALQVLKQLLGGTAGAAAGGAAAGAAVELFTGGGGMSGALFRQGATTVRPARLVMVAHPETGEPVFFRPAGRPILWSSDLAASRRVARIAARVSRARGGRRRSFR